MFDVLLRDVSLHTLSCLATGVLAAIVVQSTRRGQHQSGDNTASVGCAWLSRVQGDCLHSIVVGLCCTLEMDITTPSRGPRHTHHDTMQSRRSFGSTLSFHSVCSCLHDTGSRTAPTHRDACCAFGTPRSSVQRYVQEQVANHLQSKQPHPEPDKVDLVSLKSARWPADPMCASSSSVSCSVDVHRASQSRSGTGACLALWQQRATPHTDDASPMTLREPAGERDGGSTSESGSVATTFCNDPSNSTRTSTAPSTRRRAACMHVDKQRAHSTDTAEPLGGSVHTSSACKRTDWGANFWCVVTDPYSPLNTFFANPQTGECTWTLPAGTIVVAPHKDGEWWELIDDESGHEYYYHTRTEQSRWTRPAKSQGIVIPMAKIQKSAHTSEPNSQAKPSKDDVLEPRFVQDQHMFVLQEQQDHAKPITTPLRPRTKSLPESVHCLQKREAGCALTQRVPQRQGRVEHESQLNRLEDTQAEQAEQAKQAEELVRKASYRILLRDQKMLENARQMSRALFGRGGCEISSATSRDARHEQRRASETADSSRRALSSRLDRLRDAIDDADAVAPACARDRDRSDTSVISGAPAGEAAISSGTIQKLGKGLAFKLNTSCSSPGSTVRSHIAPSVRFISAHPNPRHPPPLHFTPTQLTTALLDAPLLSNHAPVHHDHSLTRVLSPTPTALPNQRANTRPNLRAKLAYIFACFAPYRPSKCQAI